MLICRRCGRAAKFPRRNPIKLKEQVSIGRQCTPSSQIKIERAVLVNVDPIQLPVIEEPVLIRIELIGTQDHCARRCTHPEAQSMISFALSSDIVRISRSHLVEHANARDRLGRSPVGSDNIANLYNRQHTLCVQRERWRRSAASWPVKIDLHRPQSAIRGKQQGI